MSSSEVTCLILCRLAELHKKFLVSGTQAVDVVAGNPSSRSQPRRFSSSASPPPSSSSDRRAAPPPAPHRAAAAAAAAAGLEATDLPPRAPSLTLPHGARAPSLPCLSRSPYAPRRSAYFCVKSVFMTGQRLGEISVAEKAARAALHCIPFGGSKVTSWLTTSERDRKEQCFRKSFCSRLVAHPLRDKKIADSAVSGGGARMKIFVGVSERKLYFL